VNCFSLCSCHHDVSVSQSNLNLPKSFYISAQIPRLFGLEKTNQLLASNMLQGKPWAVLDHSFHHM